MNESMREIARRLSKKHNFSEIELFKILKEGVASGRTLKTAEFALRMALPRFSGIREYFTIEDLQEVTGESRADLIAATEEMRNDAKLRGENPDDYAIVIKRER